MAQMRGRVVGEATHTVAGVKVEIRLYKKDLIFFAEYAGEFFTDQDAKKLKARVWAYIEETFNLEWIPVIQVAETQPFCHHISAHAEYMGIVIDRFYYAYTQGGRLRKAPFYLIECAEDPGKEAGEAWTWRDGGKFAPPCEAGRHLVQDAKRVFYLPYSIEVWTGLLELIKTLARAKQRLHEIVGATEVGMEQLAAVGAQILKMLPAGEEDD